MCSSVNNTYHGLYVNIKLVMAPRCITNSYNSNINSSYRRFVSNCSEDISVVAKVRLLSLQTLLLLLSQSAWPHHFLFAVACVSVCECLCLLVPMCQYACVCEGWTDAKLAHTELCVWFRPLAAWQLVRMELLRDWVRSKVVQRRGGRTKEVRGWCRKPSVTGLNG